MGCVQAQVSLCSACSAGNSLFNVVVETDDVATQLSAIMNREKSGRVTFMPLNRLNPERVSMPDDLRADARPIIEHIKFDPKYIKAMQQVILISLQKSHLLPAVALMSDLVLVPDSDIIPLSCLAIICSQSCVRSTFILTGQKLIAHSKEGLKGLKWIVKWTREGMNG